MIMADEKSKRLLSLDVFRGMTIAGMILVNNPGTWSDIYPPLRHAEWHGCTFTDLIFPFFLFIVGVAINLSLSKRKERGDNQIKLMMQILRRGATLILLGLIMAGFPHYDLSEIRIPGVLQRIGVVYIIASLIFLKTAVKTQAIIAGFLLIGYWAAMALIPVPGVGYANFEIGKNLASWLDSIVLKGHMWKATNTWDPEGFLSTIPAIATSLLGVITGKWLSAGKDKTLTTVWLLIAGLILATLGYLWSAVFPLNKNIWTSSYVLYTGGLALCFLGFSYWFIDVLGYKKWAKPFEVYGMNAITVFFLSGMVGRIMGLIKLSGADGQEIGLQRYLFENLFLSWLQPINASLAWAVTYIIIWLGLMWILYAKKIFIKV